MTAGVAGVLQEEPVDGGVSQVVGPKHHLAVCGAEPEETRPRCHGNLYDAMLLSVRQTKGGGERTSVPQP